MNILETQWWSMMLPPEWWAEHEEDSVLVGDHDDVGCIEITTLRSERGPFDSAALEQIIESAKPSGSPLSWREQALGDFQGLSCAYEEDEAAIREWCVACGETALFITYSCELENRGMDDAAVDEILDTLLPAAD